MKKLVLLAFLFCSPLLADNYVIADNYLIVETNSGDILNMEALFKEVQFDTKHGKLKIAIRDIDKIKFGTHLSQNETQKIMKAHKDLDSNVHETREKATETLIKIGRLAYYKLKDLKTSSLEGEKRRDMILERIKNRSKPEELDFLKEDLVEESENMINGLLVDDTFKFKHKLLGEVSLGKSDIKYITNHSIVNADINISANKHEWVKTGIILAKHTSILITADGQVDIYLANPGQFVVGPEGYPHKSGVGFNYPGGSLIGRVGKTTFLIGANYQLERMIGELEIMIVPSAWEGDCTGNFYVKLRN